MTFIERSIFGKAIYELKPPLLKVSGTRAWRPPHAEIPLTRLSPHYKLRASRFSGFLLLPLPFVAGSIWLIEVGLTQDAVPAEAMSIFLNFPIYVLIACIPVMFLAVRRLEFFEFYDQWKKPVLTIVRRRRDSAECDAFVSELIYAIEKAEAGEVYDAPAVRKESSVGLPSAETGGFLDTNAGWGKASMVLGLVSALFPSIAFVAPELTTTAIAVLFSSGVAGIICAFQGLERREKRLLPYLGLALNVAAMTAYFFF